MTLMEQLAEQARINEETDVSLRARAGTNIVGRKLYQVGDYLESKYDDFMDVDDNEKLENARVDAAWNKVIPPKNEKGKRQIHQEYWYDAVNDEYMPLTPSKLSASDLVYTQKKLEEEAEADSKFFYDAHYGDINKIGVAGWGFDKRHPLGRTRGAAVEEKRTKDADYLEDEVKNYMMSKNANVFDPKNMTPREPGHKNFIELGLDKGKSEVFNREKIAQTLPQIAAAIDTAQSQEEKDVLTHKYRLLQGRQETNKREAGKMKFLISERTRLEKLDEEAGGTLSPQGFGDFKEELDKNNKLFEAYKDFYNSEDTTGDLKDKPKSMQILMIQNHMAEKSNQIQEAIEDLALSKNESAIAADLLNIYRASDLTPGQATQAVAESVFDPANLVPASLAGKATKLGSKFLDAATSLFKKTPLGTKGKQVIAGATGGALSTGVEDAARQQLDVHAQRKEEIDPKQLALSTGVGALAGGTIVKALQVASTSVQKLLKGKNIEDAKTKEDVSAIVKEAKEDKTLSVEQQNELDAYELEVMQAGEELPLTYKESRELKGVKERADKIADEIEQDIEVEVAASAKPEVPKKEVQETEVPKKEEEEEESETHATLGRSLEKPTKSHEVLDTLEETLEMLNKDKKQIDKSIKAIESGEMKDAHSEKAKAHILEKLYEKKTQLQEHIDEAPELYTKETETETITVKDVTTGEDIEIDLGTTTQATKTPIVELKEADRLPFAKEFILGKERVRRVGDTTETEGDIPLSSAQQVHKQGRGVSTAAVDKAQRTVEQKVPVKETPEASVDAVMKSYKLSQQATSLDPDKRILNKISEMEHRILAIEGMKAHYTENNIPGDFAKLDLKKNKLIADIETRGKNINDKQIEFDSKAEFAKENLPSPERTAEIKLVEETLQSHKLEGMDVPKLIKVLEKITDFALGQKVLQRIKRTGDDQVLPSDTTAYTPLLGKIKQILNATDRKGDPLSSGRIQDRLRQEVPDTLKKVFMGANDDASKIVMMKLQKEFDDAAGFTRLKGTTTTKSAKKDVKSQSGDKPKGPKQDHAREAVVESWKTHNPKNEKKKVQNVLKTETHERSELDATGIKSEIYLLMAKKDISARDKNELMEALTHEKTQSQTLSPLELSKQKKEQYIERKNNEESQRIFKKKLEATDTTPVHSTRELFDASSQVAQIVGAFFGNIDMFRAIGATIDSIGKDYRLEIGKKLQNDGIIPKSIKDVKAVVKVPTRNVTYLEGRSSAIIGMMDELKLPYDQASRIYDGIMSELEAGKAGGLLQYASKIAKHVEAGDIPPRFELTLPDGRKIKVDARAEEDVVFRMFGVEFKSTKKVDKAKPGTVAATIVQSIDSYIKDSIIKKMSNYDGITVHDGFAFKTDAQKAEATKIYFEALKKIHEDNYFNKMLTDISGGKIKEVPNEPIKWNDVVPEKLFSVEFKKGTVEADEIKTNLSLNSDRLMEPTEILSSLLNAADPTGKTGFSGMRHSVVRFLAKSEANQTNPQTYLSELDDLVAHILSPDSLEGMHKMSKGWQQQWMKKNKIPQSAQANKAFEQLANMIRATAESIPEFKNNRLMEREQVMNQYARIYFKNLAEAQDETFAKTNDTFMNNAGKDTPIEKIIKDSKPEELPQVMDVVKESIQEENGKDIPTIAQEKKIIEADGEKIDETIETDGDIKTTFDKAYLAIRKALINKKLTDATVSHATHNAVKRIQKIFKDNAIDRKLFKKNILDTGFRHIRGMNKEQASRFVKLHKSTIEKYSKYIDAKARAHTNPNERYGYFRNNMLELVMEKEGLSPEKAAVRANAILKLSAIKNMTDSHWKYVEKDNINKATREYLDIIDIWDGVAKESVFKTGKTNFNDSYLATIRSKKLIDLDMEPESMQIELHTLGKKIDDEATLKSLNETTNREGYMETNKIRKVGKDYYRILVDEKAEKNIMDADPVDILSKTIFTTMAKTLGSDETKNTRKLLKNSTIFSDTKQKDMRPLTKAEIANLSNKASLDSKEITAKYVNVVLGRQIFGRDVKEPLGGKVHGFLSKLTKDFKYNAVPINPSSILNGLGWTIASVVGRFPLRGPKALVQSAIELKAYKKLDNAVNTAMESGNVIRLEKALEARAKSDVFKAISEGMAINSIDGIMLSHSVLKETAEKAFGKDTKLLHAMRTLFLRPHTPVAEQLVKLFSMSDSIGRYASYKLIKGTRHDTGVGAGIKANATFGDMLHISNPLVETADTIPLTAFAKWGERTFIELLKLPRLEQASLIASGLLITELAEGIDVEDKGMNPLVTFATMADDFVVAPVQDNYNKYQGETSEFEHAVRTATPFVLPSTYNKLLLSYLFDTRNGSVQAKTIKLLFPPRGVAYDNPANGTRISYKGNKIPLTTFDSRPWYEQMMTDDSKKTQEQYDAGQWRRDLLESIVGTDQIKQWKKENRLIKLERLKASDPAYGHNLF